MSAAIEYAVPVSPHDPVNRAILEVSEDRIHGFVREPVREIAKLSGLNPLVVVERIRAMLEAGTIRRVRQTLLATNLAQGALIAWKIDDSLIDAAFDFIAKHDPFSGHVVIRNGSSSDFSTAPASASRSRFERLRRCTTAATCCSAWPRKGTSRSTTFSIRRRV